MHFFNSGSANIPTPVFREHLLCAQMLRPAELSVIGIIIPFLVEKTELDR